MPWIRNPDGRRRVAPDEARCTATASHGERCAMRVMTGQALCRAHARDEQRVHSLTIQLSPNDYDLVQRLAEAGGVSMAEVIRAALRDSDLAAMATQIHRRQTASHVAQILGQIAKIGNNVNQIAHALNSAQHSNLDRSALDTAARELRGLRLAVLGVSDGD